MGAFDVVRVGLEVGLALDLEHVDALAVVVDRVAVVVDEVDLEALPDEAGDEAHTVTDVVVAQVRVVAQADSLDQRVELLEAAVDQAQAVEVDHGSVPRLVHALDFVLGDEQDGVEHHPAGQAVGVRVGGLLRAVVPPEQVLGHAAEVVDGV